MPLSPCAAVARGRRLGRRTALAAALAVPLLLRARDGSTQQLPAPAVPIQALDDALLQIMHAGHPVPFAERVRTLTPAVENAFDLRQILQTSVGLRWSSFSPAQQQQLLDVFTRYTVASYVANFDSYNGERFEILPALRQIGADQVVQTRIIPSSGDSTRIDYVMHATPSGWKAVDVLLDGSISRVAVQRSDFRSLLAGGDPSRLIASLRTKTANLERGGSQ
jgi:phospholipid transport system substrate-binding protein